MAIVVVTHDVELAAALADRVLMLSQGEMIAEGRRPRCWARRRSLRRRWRGSFPTRAG